MGIITLLTDFGITDEYVGVMKGAILSVNPDATIIDITHNIDPQDLIQAAYTLESSYKYFPEGTVHIIVVDPGVGSDRAILAAEAFGHILLAPDNGVLTFFTDQKILDSVVRVDNSIYFSESVSQTFHGRDIFAPVAAHITKGVGINRLGTPVDHTSLVRLDIRKPYISDSDELIGSVVSTDRFGNLITNIDESSLERFCRKDIKKKAELWFRGCCITGLASSYESAKPQSPLAIVGSRGYLEIAVNCGSAGNHFKAGKGDSVRIKLSERTED
ncbi:SAM-dependent chlorinase/fluorinase [Desulfococcaceae bacterium HSG8]|nr:SAM-dependent chlorinase/fluorinase [Desulfococcaceae bacterium HSG8]